jgi:4a-hydroxytetrahydrobiopterin dehydratase
MMTQTPLDDTVIHEGLQELTRWRREGDEIVRDHQDESVLGAVGLIVQIAELAEEHDHHPDLRWVYNRLTIRFTTHDLGGLSELDFRLAREVEDLLEAR